MHLFGRLSPICLVLAELPAESRFWALGVLRLGVGCTGAEFARTGRIRTGSQVNSRHGREPTRSSGTCFAAPM